MNGQGGVITGDAPTESPFPKFIDLTPPKEEKNEESFDLPLMEEDPLPFERDPTNPTRSYLRINPQDNSEGYVCFAKNRVGHSTVPCIFKLDVIGIA